jgi:F1F0 ATPase subunit 2
MNETFILALAACAGAGIGILYFLGLWFTVKQIKEAKNPALITFGSFVGRTAAAAFLFYLLVRSGHWERGLAALAGFILSRIVLVRLQKRREHAHTAFTSGGHA